MAKMSFPYGLSLFFMSVIPGAWRRTAAGAGLLASDGTVAPTIFAEMSAAAARTGAINLGQGFPDEDGPAEVLEAARSAIASGANQYPPGRGIPDLLSAISEHQKRFYGLDVDPDTEVIVTAGATEALTATILALIDDADDEVVVFEPYYDSYAAAVALALRPRAPRRPRSQRTSPRREACPSPSARRPGARLRARAEPLCGCRKRRPVRSLSGPPRSSRTGAGAPRTATPGEAGCLPHAAQRGRRSARRAPWAST